jgi:hypothetical protein
LTITIAKIYLVIVIEIGYIHNKRNPVNQSQRDCIKV